MRNSTASYVPVTGAPLPAEVRSLIHQRIRQGERNVGANEVEPGLFTVHGECDASYGRLVEVGA